MQTAVLALALFLTEAPEVTAESVQQAMDEAKRDRIAELARKYQSNLALGRGVASGRTSSVESKRIGAKAFLRKLRIENAAIKKEAKEIEDGKVQVFPSLAFKDAAVGRWGLIQQEKDGTWVRVLDVIDDDEFLGTIGYQKVSVQQVGQSGAVSTSRQNVEGKIPYWFSGISTENLVDDKTMRLDGFYRVTGKKTYETVVGGSQTVFVVEPFDPTPFLPKDGEEK